MGRGFISTIPMPAEAVAVGKVLGCNLFFMIANRKRLLQIEATSLFFPTIESENHSTSNYKNHFSLEDSSCSK
jgi:hypothetical protein